MQQQWLTQSTDWFSICALGYLFSLIVFFVHIVSPNEKLRKIGTITTALAFFGQTIGMAFRWHEAGIVELASIQLAADVQLEGMAKWVVYTQHPPWSNLYEIMVFMAWGLILVFLVTEVKWRIPFIGVFTLFIALLPFGLVSLGGLDGTVQPLVPALQSWWIMIHVISSAIGYSAGTIGAVLSLLYLVAAKDKITLAELGGGVLAFSSLLLLILGRVYSLLTTGDYLVKVVGSVGDRTMDAGRFIDNRFAAFRWPSPGVGPLLLLSIGLCLILGIFLVVKGRKARLSGDTAKVEQQAKILYSVAYGATLITGLLMLANAFFQTDLQFDAETVRQLSEGGAPAPWRLDLLSNQWDFVFMAIILGGQSFVCLAIWFPDKIRRTLGKSELFDRAAYYTILVSFALVAVVLVTGALWAHYAWGRYWGWDPKETGALVIWLVYAIYLHTRVTYGWVGIPSAVIGVIGFFVIIAGFLGVNLGWFADGLHSYGSS